MKVGRKKCEPLQKRTPSKFRGLEHVACRLGHRSFVVSSRLRLPDKTVSDDKSVVDDKLSSAAEHEKKTKKECQNKAWCLVLILYPPSK